MTKNISRRRFLKTSAVAGVAAPYFVPARLLGADAPSNQLRMASIGTGRMGHGDMQACMQEGLRASANARVVAVCDLDSKRAEHARNTILKFYADKLPDGAKPTVDVYEDYREVLARNDIDGLTISLPDHQHALIAVAAAKAGKDMYLQKPLTYTIGEGQQLIAAVRANNVVLQTGSQQRSDAKFRQACELVRNGRLGKLTKIRVTVPTDKGSGRDEPTDPPANLNYEAWLGPTPVVPYSEHRVHPQKDFSRPGWLQIEPYCRGMITGWGSHMFDIAQ
ncbi:MAG: Gfo/Idh/MocA family oxidoreductase, partial [Planctomycetales bacterium]|nr:Gfo/Idh/MocA family oxidoreductase [Planctomycetales bacterium]